MANCKLCKTNIPNGEEYCKDCLDKTNTKSNESYLDSLLNSVQESAPTIDTIYKKRNDIEIEESDNNQNIEEESDFREEDIFKFDLEDIEDLNQFDFNNDLKDFNEEFSINNEDLFGETLYPADADEINNQLFEPVKEDILTNNISANEINDFSEEDSYETDLNSILNQLEDIQSNQESIVGDEDKILPSNNEIQEELAENSDNKQKDSEQPYQAVEDYQEELEQVADDDFLSLLNQISDDDPVAEDIKAIGDLMNGIPLEPSMESTMPSDVGEVFSDALKVVSNLNDPNVNEGELPNQILDKEKKKEKKKKEKKSKKTNKNLDAQESEEKPKTGLFHRLFGNVEDKSASKKAKLPPEDLENSEPDKVNKAKSKKAKKGKVSVDKNESEGKDGDTAKNKKIKKAKKKEKKDKKPKSTDVIQVIDVIEEDTGRINRLGASIVFVFFGLLALLIYVGTNAASYTQSIQHATTYFNSKKYTEAYEEVYGIKVADKDVEIYSKIMTVMYVNKQLNSYNNYCSIKDYPNALDSLLKGLKRYDKYIEYATFLGIKTDMNYVRGQILAELNNKFDLPEKDALSIMSINNKKEYSLKIYDVAQAN